MVKLRHLYSNLLPGPETLAELRDRASARLRPANQAPVRQVQHRLGPARIEELIAAYRRGATAAALAVKFQIHRTTAAALLELQKNRLKELGVTKRHIASPSLTGSVENGLGGCQTLGVELVHPGPFDVPGPAQLLEDPDQPRGDVNLSLQNAVTGAARVGVV